MWYQKVLRHGQEWEDSDETHTGKYKKDTLLMGVLTRGLFRELNRPTRFDKSKIIPGKGNEWFESGFDQLRTFRMLNSFSYVTTLSSHRSNVYGTPNPPEHLIDEFTLTGRLRDRRE